MQIHWHEGLFLLPHHLQRLQRGFHEQFRRERKLAWPYSYGAVEARLSTDDLENFTVRFNRLRAFMPSGLEIDYPATTDLPTLNIKEALDANGSATIHLASPLWFDDRANCTVDPEGANSRAKILFKIGENEFADENTGGNPKTLLTRRINARLILDSEDRSDLETIPLLRVVRSAGENLGSPRQDPEFSGPCMILHGSASLSDLVRDLSGQVEASREELLVQINRGGFTIDAIRGPQIEQILRLQALNRAAYRLESLLAAPTISPFDIYVELQGLLGELSALRPDRDLGDCPPYDHDDPHPCFRDISHKIRLYLRGSVAPNYIKVPFVPADGLLRASLTEDHFTKPNDYLLGIRTKEDPLSLARYVENEDRFKLMPTSMANRAIRGILLKEERFPPLELPSQSGLYYFRLLRGQCPEVWRMIESEKSAIVRWSENDNADYQVTLYMTLPPNA